MAAGGKAGRKRSDADPDDGEAMDPFSKNAGLRPGLADEIARFIQDYPQFGIKFRSEFANRACEHYLGVLRRKLYLQMELEAKRDGRPGPLQATKDLAEDDD
jgi:hypothetical protein